MKNIKNIIEQKYPPENPNDLWMKDNVLYKSTHKGWTPLTAGGGSSTNGVTSTTWLELKDKRDAGKLIPGAFYRITDYNCTTTQENTQSAGHQFDIVLLALSENKLAEEGWAMMHDNIYDVTFADNVTLKCYLYITSYDDEETWYYNIVRVDNLMGYPDDINTDVEINEENKTAVVGPSSDGLITPSLPYNYFQNSNLSAWKVWYCLDNDKSRFAWADDSVDESIEETITYRDYMVRTMPRNSSIDKVQDGTQYYGWGTGIYTKTLDIVIGETQVWNSVGIMVNVVEAHTLGHEGTGLPNGRGVIYRLIDEWNNDVPYDFKNIQYLLVGNNYVYTLLKQESIGDSLIDASVFNDGFVYNNYISRQIDKLEGGEILARNILIQSSGCSVIGLSSKNNMIGGSEITLINCNETRINYSDSILISCSKFTPEESGYYLVNKKILTES